MQVDVIQDMQALLTGTNSSLRDDYRDVAQLTPVLLEVAPPSLGSARRLASPGGW